MKNKYLPVAVLASMLFAVVGCESFQEFELIPSETIIMGPDTTMNTDMVTARAPLIYLKDFEAEDARNEGTGSSRESYFSCLPLVNATNGNSYLRGLYRSNFRTDFLRFDTMESCTFNYWIKGAAGQREILVSKSFTDVDSLIQLAISGDRIRFTDLRNDFSTGRVTNQLLNNSWKMLTVQLDNMNTRENNGIMSVYIDGEPFEEINNTLLSFPGDSTYFFMNGLRNDIDEIAFYDRLLSPGEIDSIYAVTSPLFPEGFDPDIVVPENLFSYYHFNGESLRDDLGLRDGLPRLVEITPGGPDGNGFSAVFDSTNRSHFIINNHIMEEISEMTLSFWINTQSTAYHPILGQDAFSSFFTERSLCWSLENQFFIGEDGPGMEFGYDASEVFNSGGWSMVTITCARVNAISADVTQANLYINGTNVSTVPDTEIDFDRIRDAFIGFDGEGTSFHGQLDNIRLYNRTLSDAEVNSIYLAEKE
jgi:hypothetical protein